MRVGSLFSGIGGFDRGFEAAGMEIVWQSEIDKNASKVLAKHWPGVVNHGDITKIDPDRLERVDLICGGFPCQDVSQAGRRAGLKGSRSGLFWEAIRMAEATSPKWMVIENVPGLLSSNGGDDFQVVLEAMVELGYGVSWRMLDAQYFGVPQRRRRVFIVGCLGDVRSAGQVLFDPEGRTGDPESSGEEGAITATGTEDGAGKSGSVISKAPTEPGFIGPKLAATLTSGSDGRAGRRQEDDYNIVASAIRSEGRFVIDGTQDPVISEDISPALSGKSRHIHGTLRSNYRNNSNPMTEVNSLVSGPVAHTLAAHASKGGDPTTDNYAFAEGMGLRRLTPLECERLQGFPDGWTAAGTEQKAVFSEEESLGDEAEIIGWKTVPISDTARYKMLGNAVAVPVARWLGHRIVSVENP